MSKGKFNLIVVEGHWSNYSNHTVKSLFDLLSDLLRSNVHAYKYSQFTDPASFDSCIRQLVDDSHRYLYVGSHGYMDGIYGASQANPLTFTKIKNRISGINGLFLGTCLFGQQNTLIDFAKHCDDLVWCAGYKNSVDWVDSSALDLAFWKIFQTFNTKSGAQVELAMIDRTLQELKSKYSSLILELGFNVAIKRKVAKGKVEIKLAF
jgi:hypothetical protein